MGNLRECDSPSGVGVQELIASNRSYPDYLNENICRVANPGQSLQAITVASARYALAITFEIVGQEVAIYEQLRVANQELHADLEVGMEAELELEMDEELSE